MTTYYVSIPCLGIRVKVEAANERAAIREVRKLHPQPIANGKPIFVTTK